MTQLPLAIEVGFFDRFLETDISVFEWVQKLQQTAAEPVLTFILKVLTYLGEGGILFLAFAIGLLLTKKYKKAGLAVLGALGIMVILNNVVLKSLFARPRPFNLYEDGRMDIIRDQYAWWAQRYTYPDIVSRPQSLSFPSGHSSSAFCAAFAGAFASKKFKIALPMFILAALVAFSRIYVEVHYFTDVAFGALVGFIYGILGTLLVWFIWKKWGDKIDALIEKAKAAVLRKKA